MLFWRGDQVLGELLQVRGYSRGSGSQRDLRV